MNSRYPRLAALILGLVLIAHAVLAFTKLRWVTGLLELVAAALLFWKWWTTLRTATTGIYGSAIPVRSFASLFTNRTEARRFPIAGDMWWVYEDARTGPPCYGPSLIFESDHVARRVRVSRRLARAYRRAAVRTQLVTLIDAESARRLGETILALPALTHAD